MSGGDSISPTRSRGSVALTVSFYVLLVVIAWIQAFVTFRGLGSPAGMDQAQIAREIARGNGFHTKFIRPYAWQQLLAGGKEVTIPGMEDTFQPPLQPLIWAPVFKLLERWSEFDPTQGSAIYLFDRVIACMGVAWMLMSIAITYLAMRRLFDEKIAAITSLILALCQPLWEIAVSGSSQALVMLAFAVAFWCFAGATTKARSGESPWLSLLGVGIASGVMVMSHWMAVWLVLGLIAATAILIPQRLRSSLLVAAIPVLCLAGWCWRNHVQCGDPLGATKATLQSLLTYHADDILLRDFVSMNAPVAVDSLLRKVGANFVFQWQDALLRLGSVLPAWIFFLALLHRFRREDVGASRWGLGIVWLFTAAGMALLGLDGEQMDDNDLFCALVPAMTGFGVAMLAVLWARLGIEGGWFWREWGYAVIAVMISALPMAVKLPSAIRVGIAYRGQLANWPPYMPDRFARLGGFMTSRDVLFSDAPWALAWYADCPTVWIPVSRSQFEPMKTRIEAQGGNVAGFVMTPISARVERLPEIFDGSYREWADVVYRGPMIAFQQEVRSVGAFPYNAVYPLYAVPLPETGGLNVMLVYYADKIRWDTPKPGTAAK